MTQLVNPVVVAIDAENLEPETSLSLRNNFAPFFERTQEWRDKANAIVVTDATDKESMLRARALRLEIREVRVNTENTRKRLKEDSLRKGKIIDKVAGIIKDALEPIEEQLQSQEDFAKIQEFQLNLIMLSKHLGCCS